MSNIRIVSATEARNNWFEILNWVNYQKGEVLVKKNNKIFFKITAAFSPTISSVNDVLKKVYGRLSHKKAYFPYEDKKVINRERKVNNPNQLWRKR